MTRLPLFPHPKNCRPPSADAPQESPLPPKPEGTNREKGVEGGAPQEFSQSLKLSRWAQPPHPPKNPPAHGIGKPGGGPGGGWIWGLSLDYEANTPFLGGGAEEGGITPLPLPGFWGGGREDGLSPKGMSPPPPPRCCHPPRLSPKPPGVSPGARRCPRRPSGCPARSCRGSGPCRLPAPWKRRARRDFGMDGWVAEGRGGGKHTEEDDDDDDEAQAWPPR